MDIGLGIDVGGTNTDAVLLDLRSKKVILSNKSPTTYNDLSIGIKNVISKFDRSFFPKISLTSISTTLATNSIVEGFKNKISAFLIGYDPKEFVIDLNDEIHFVKGGHNVKGEEKSPLDIDYIKAAILKSRDFVEGYAVSSFFSVRNPEHELCTKELINRYSNKPVTLGSELSFKLDAKTRAMTVILNAHLIPIIYDLLDSVKKVFKSFNINTPIMVVKGDGSLIDEKEALYRPIETILSGPAASVVGAKSLIKDSKKAKNGIVIDIGGTTTDIAILKDGQPEINFSVARVGRWKIHLKAIKMETIGVGGDSEIKIDSEGNIEVGPNRVIPICYLGCLYPEVNKELISIDKSVKSIDISSKINFYTLEEKNNSHNLSNLEEDILEQLFPSPASLFQISKTLNRTIVEITKALKKLEKKGFIKVSGFTPTDIFHIKGLYTEYNKESSELAYKILSKSFLNNKWDLLKRIETVVYQNIGVKILGMLSKNELNKDLYHFLWDLSSNTSNYIDGLECKINLHKMIIGVGAPSYAMIPSLTKIFNAKPLIPQYAEVANAIGAITSSVVIMEEAIIKPYKDGFNLHFSTGLKFFQDLEEANIYGNDILRKIISKKAKRAGVKRLNISFEEKDNIVKTKGGNSIFIEKRIIAKGIGKPRLD
ncbi:MAG: hydantoinase/oxoprolinase family protein [Deltaproteobacteria bacterium]|nr:hydantoinase/oxoprolinase family protein [Deltaproteobacteria bacterium]